MALDFLLSRLDWVDLDSLRDCTGRGLLSDALAYRAWGVAESILMTDWGREEVGVVLRTAVQWRMWMALKVVYKNVAMDGRFG